MAAEYHSIDLDRLALSPGQGRRLELDVGTPEVELGGQTYALAERAARIRLDVSRTAAGYAFRLRFRGELAGPCMRCLEPGQAGVEIDAREVEQGGTGDAELSSPYVDAGELDIGAWARDALVLALPAQILCRPECAGLCPVCGASLNEVDPATHRHEREPDPRWAKLRELE